MCHVVFQGVNKKKNLANMSNRCRVSLFSQTERRFKVMQNVRFEFLQVLRSQQP